MKTPDDESAGGGEDKQAIDRELRAMNHPHVTRCFGGFFVGRYVYKLVLERMECSLQDVISAF